MHDVAADQTEFALKSLGAKNLVTQNGRAEAGCIGLNCADDIVCGLALFGVPIARRAIRIGR